MHRRLKLLKRALDGGLLQGEDFIALAQAWGIEVRAPRGGGSHYGLYVGATRRIGTVKIPASGPVKRVYVRELLEAIETIRLTEEQEQAGDQPDGSSEEG